MSLVVIIRGVTGLILLWRVMLGPDRTFLTAPIPGWSQADRSALTGSRMHHTSQHIATRHPRPVMGSLAVFLLQWKKRYEKCCLIIVVWCSLVPTFRPARNYRLLLPTKTGLWALRSQAQGEWTGAGSQAGAGTEPGASSRDRVGGMLLLGNRLIYFLMRARRERSRHESAGAVGEMRNSTFVGTFIWNLFSQHKGLLPRKPQFFNTWCPKKINF